MTGKFIITRQHLAELGACTEGMAFYDQTYPAGRAEYQDMLDQAVKACHTDYATWLLSQIGPTEDVLNLESINDAGLDIVFAGHIKIRFGAILRSLICGLSIEAGEGIEAGFDIKAGEYGVYAGLSIKPTEWSKYAVVTAKTKPANLISGFWRDRGDV